jgi:hypothetical protein
MTLIIEILAFIISLIVISIAMVGFLVGIFWGCVGRKFEDWYRKEGDIK